MKSNIIKIIIVMMIFEIFVSTFSPVSRAENGSFTLETNNTIVDIDEIIDVELNLSDGMKKQNQL